MWILQISSPLLSSIPINEMEFKHKQFRVNQLTNCGFSRQVLFTRLNSAWFYITEVFFLCFYLWFSRIQTSNYWFINLLSTKCYFLYFPLPSLSMVSFESFMSTLTNLQQKAKKPTKSSHHHYCSCLANNCKNIPFILIKKLFKSNCS